MENKYPYIGKSEVTGDVFLLTAQYCGYIIECKHSNRIGSFSKNLHETYFANISADYLRNTKIRIESPEHSKMIQRLVFNAGGKWGIWSIGSRNVMINPRAEYLFVDDRLVLNSFTKSPDIYNGEIIREIKLPMPPKQASDEWPKVGDVVSLRYKHDSKSIHLTGNLEFLSSKHIIVNDCHKLRCDYDVEKPQAQLEILADLLEPIITANSDMKTGGIANEIAKAILAGEIEGLEYKKPQ